MKKFLHMLGKDARKEVISYALKKYSISELSNMLGVSKPAVIKYIKGTTHPSDEVLQRLMEEASIDLRRKIYEMIAGELLEAFEGLLKSYGEEYGYQEKEMLRKQMCRVICGGGE